jgi:hypothetical protein
VALSPSEQGLGRCRPTDTFRFEGPSLRHATANPDVDLESPPSNAVEAAGKKYDAYKLGKDCMAEWSGYLRSKGLLT